MSPEYGQADLNGEIVFDRFLGNDELDALQRMLARLAPKWAARLRTWCGPRDQHPIDVADPGALGRAVLAAAGERGETYRRLVAEHGPGPAERLAGSVELRGAGPELIVIASVDEIVLSTMGSRRLLGNRIAFQVRRPLVARRPGAEWLADALGSLAGELSPAWGYAGHAAEYWAKVMSDTPRIEAVGRDFGRHLPGVFWLNFFGPRYVDLIGANRFAGLPAGMVTPVDGGSMVRLSTDPLAWTSPDYAIDERAVRDHLGRQHFFEKPDR